MVLKVEIVFEYLNLMDKDWFFDWIELLFFLKFVM